MIDAGPRRRWDSPQSASDGAFSTTGGGHETYPGTSSPGRHRELGRASATRAPPPPRHREADQGPAGPVRVRELRHPPRHRCPHQTAGAAARLSATRTGSPGSLMSTWPRRSRLTRAASLSAHLTRRPRDARHAAVVRPTYLHRSRRRGSLVSARIAPCSRRSPQGCGHSDTTTARRSFRSVRSAVCDPFRGTRRPCGRAHRPRVRTAPSRAVHERE